MSGITFTNLSGASEIGSNCYLLEVDGASFVLDVGMHPKKEGNAAKPYFELLEGTDPDAVFVTHAHLDHIGTLPVLQELYPHAEVIMTPATAGIGNTMLHNSVNVMSAKRMFDGIAEYPFFTHGELERAAAQWVTRPYETPFRVGRHGEALATLYDAGHILGSCGVLLETQSGCNIFYTGDVQFEDQSIISSARFPQSGVDVLIMECTHGATERAADYSRRAELLRMAQTIRETLEGGGAVLIPVFALGKSQELLYELEQFRRKGLIPNAPIFFGGLGAKITGLYDKFADETPRLLPGMRLRNEVETTALPRASEAPLRAMPGNIYLVSSGMMSPHTLSNTLAAQVLPRAKDALLFVGYSDPDTPAARIKKAAPGDLVRLGESPTQGQAYPVYCRVESFDFSGHAPRTAMLDYAVKLAPKRILLVHGDEAALQEMRHRLQELLPDSRVNIPLPGARVALG